MGALRFDIWKKFSSFHQTQFRTLRHSSALSIFCVKLYFQSFMSNLNSCQLHSDLNRIPNLPWTPNPFHNKRTDMRKCIVEPDLFSLKLSYSQEFFNVWLLTRALTHSQINIHWKQGYCIIGSSTFNWTNCIGAALIWDENRPSDFRHLSCVTEA